MVSRRSKQNEKRMTALRVTPSGDATQKIYYIYFNCIYILIIVNVVLELFLLLRSKEVFLFKQNKLVAKKIHVIFKYIMA